MMRACSPTRTIRSLVCMGAAFATAILTAGSVSAQPGATYEPSRGQSGKDVVWIPTPDALVTRMLKLAQVRAGDHVVDLGAGDGRIVIAAARDFGARALGLEFDARLVEHAKRKAEEAGVSGRAEFRQGDIFIADFSGADVVTMYLLPDLNLRLRPTLLAMKPGTRVVSHQFTLGNWQPDETSWVENRPAYLWIVPANAGGTWQATYSGKEGPAAAQLTVEQAFQKVKGTLEFGAVRTWLRHPQMEGQRFRFAFTDGDGIVRQVDATVAGDRMVGTVSKVGTPGGEAGTGAGTEAGARAGKGGTEQAGEFKAMRSGPLPVLGGSAPASSEELTNALQILGE